MTGNARRNVYGVKLVRGPFLKLPPHYSACESSEALGELTRRIRRDNPDLRLAADLFDDLDPGELATRTLCPVWTAHAMAAHLVMPLEVQPLRFAVEIARHKGSMDRASEAVVARLAQRPATAGERL